MLAVRIILLRVNSFCGGPLKRFFAVRSMEQSITFTGLIDRMKNCPWSDQIKVEFGISGTSGYDAETNVLHINRNELKGAELVARFAHECYHASHQDHYKLFLDPSLGNGPASREQYIKMRLDQETRAEQIETNKELHSGTGIQFLEAVREPWGAYTPHKVDLSQIYEKGGYKALYEFLATHHAVKDRTPSGGCTAQPTYEEYYGKNRYDEYLHSFQKEQQKAKKLFEDFCKHHKPEEFKNWNY